MAWQHAHSKAALGNDEITISKSEAAEFGYTGEEQRGLGSGPGHLSVQADQFAQALRTLTNQIESDVSGVAYVAASRAHGTAGTTPFGSSLGTVRRFARFSTTTVRLRQTVSWSSIRRRVLRCARLRS